MSSQYSRDSLENIVPYSFRKKKSDGSEEQIPDPDSVAVPANNLKKTKSIMNQSPNQQISNNIGDRDRSRPAYGLNFGMPEMMREKLISL